MKNLYSILEVDSSASSEKIKSSYRTLVKKYHPDAGGDEEKCKEITMAYSILSDEKKRKDYDNMNPIQQENKFNFIKKLLEVFVYKSEDYKSLIDYLFSNKYTNIKDLFSNTDFDLFKNEKQSEKEKEKENKNKIEKTIVILDIDEAYNKKYYRFNLSNKNYIIPVVNDSICISNRDNTSTIIDIKIISSPNIKIKNNDLIVEKYISLFDYVYGFNLSFNMPNGISIKKKIQSLLHRDTIDIIENAGLFYIKKNNNSIENIELLRGDLYIDFKVKNIDTDDLDNFTNFKNLLKNIT